MDKLSKIALASYITTIGGIVSALYVAESFEDRPKEMHLSRVYDINTELERANIEQVIKNEELRGHLEDLVKEREEIKSSFNYIKEKQARSNNYLPPMIVFTGVAFSGMVGVVYSIYKILKGH